MTPADRILLSLDAHECLAGLSFDLEGGLCEAPVIQNGEASFGSIAGVQTVDELQFIMKSWAYRMQQLGQAYAAIATSWKAKDPTAQAGWLADWNALQARYNAALGPANAAVTGAALSILRPNNMIPAQGEYDGLMKAMRQCYPPDGCAVRKGDFDDLNMRLQTAATSLGGAGPQYADQPQPTSTDFDQQLFAATAPIDVIAQVTGQQAGGPIPPGPMDFLKWLKEHKTALIATGVILVGGLVLLELKAVTAIPLAAAKGLAAIAA